MALPHWVHCNQCFHVMVRQERKFFHLACRHVLCRPCMGKTERGTTCPICKQPIGRFTELNNQMEREEKMYYEPGVLKAYANVCQTVVFQHKQRENLIRGILRCKKELPQLKEMQNLLRQRIVETQRQYEKHRTYRRNLQDIMRQNSPAYGRSSLGTQGPHLATSTFAASSSTATHSPIHTGQGEGGALVGAWKNNNVHQSKSDDSGYSGTRTPSSSVLSRSMVHSHGGPSLPMTPAFARQPQDPANCNPLHPTISRR